MPLLELDVTLAGLFLPKNKLRYGAFKLVHFSKSSANFFIASFIFLDELHMKEAIFL
jgi:hypothetical protein